MRKKHENPFSSPLLVASRFSSYVLLWPRGERFSHFFQYVLQYDLNYQITFICILYIHVICINHCVTSAFYKLLNIFRYLYIFFCVCIAYFFFYIHCTLNKIKRFILEFAYYEYRNRVRLVSFRFQIGLEHIAQLVYV